MKKNIIIIVLLLVGTVGYLIAEKVISNRYENGSINDNNDNNKNNEDSKELELNSFLVT